MIDYFMYETRYILGKKVWKDDWKNWMLRTQRAIVMKTLEELHPYISVCANIQTSDEGRWDILGCPRL